MVNLKDILTEEERAVCKLFAVKYISRDRLDGEGDYVHFWSGKPHRIHCGRDGIAYLNSTLGELIFKVSVKRYNTRIKPGDLVLVMDDGLCKYVAVEGVGEDG